MSLLLVFEVLGLFVNTLTAENKFSLRNSENLPQQFQMQLSKKRETSSVFFLLFLKCTSNFEHFEMKDDPHTLYIFETTDCEACG